ncbi:acyl-CoA thioesterase [Billgrantia kenyensis]|uniref:Acyl-CoA thioesterase n=1 Tax=Billgrantia kenyensis TaxID=321266 RepID=A0A7W0ADD0_9GAMM|nr:thioesterase family protein [Halomonas kenyensis]MBA2778479.1 acyl-CoA thioesterase [Halomonas kenyensis]MCG6660784.1 acyl-CoA thioesterase [Halomonas kenyensis]
MPFTTQRKVRFQHCDPAGIVFYPRYFEMLNSVVEDFFAEAVGHDFNQLHVENRTGVPTAHIETDFHAPSRLGETLTFELTIRDIGRTSMALRTVALCNGEPRLTCDSTLVFIDLDSGRPLPWPDAMRRRFATEDSQGKQP